MKVAAAWDHWSVEEIRDADSGSSACPGPDRPCEVGVRVMGLAGRCYARDERPVSTWVTTGPVSGLVTHEARYQETVTARVIRGARGEEKAMESWLEMEMGSEKPSAL